MLLLRLLLLVLLLLLLLLLLLVLLLLVLLLLLLLLVLLLLLLLVLLLLLLLLLQQPRQLPRSGTGLSLPDLTMSTCKNGSRETHMAVIVLFNSFINVSFLPTSKARALAFIMGSVSGKFKFAFWVAIAVSTFRMALRSCIICSGRGRPLNMAMVWAPG